MQLVVVVVVAVDKDIDTWIVTAEVEQIERVHERWWWRIEAV